MARPRLLALGGITLLVVPFVVPWLFVSPPHGPRFYEIVAQVFPVLVLVWVIELRGTVWLDVAAEPDSQPSPRGRTACCSWWAKVRRSTQRATALATARLWHSRLGLSPSSGRASLLARRSSKAHGKRVVLENGSKAALGARRQAR
jgi:hypothetical protein